MSKASPTKLKLTLGQLAKKNGQSYLVIAIVVGVALVFVSDRTTPTGVAVWVLYIPVICLSFFVERPLAPVLVAALCSILVILDFFIFADNSNVTAILLARRGIGIFCFWVVGTMVRQFILSNARLIETQRNLLESTDNLAKEKTKLERSNRELEQFAGVAAHDLRSPLKTMRSWVEMLSSLIPNPRSAELDQALTFVQNNARKADDLVEAVLEIARVNISTSHAKSVDLQKMLGEILEMHRLDIQNAQAQIHFTDLPTVQGNPNYLQSLFSNLIRNALIYKDKSRKPEIFIGFKDRTDEYEFFVKDNGIGIKPEHTERVFEMFKRLHSERDYPGTGIGLALCKKVIELSGGRIWVDSLYGSGSTFYFTYPKAFQERNV